jgi:hypothetical protein
MGSQSASQPRHGSKQFREISEDGNYGTSDCSAATFMIVACSKTLLENPDKEQAARLWRGARGMPVNGVSRRRQVAFSHGGDG